MLKNKNIYKPSADWMIDSHINSLEKYNELYNESIQDPVGCWSRIAKRISWYKPWDKVREFDFENYICVLHIHKHVLYS